MSSLLLLLLLLLWTQNLARIQSAITSTHQKFVLTIIICTEVNCVVVFWTIVC